MIKRFLAQHLKAVLSELFENADAVFGSSLPTTASLFAVLCGTTAPEHPLILKPDIFDIMLQPLRLVSGTVGRIALDGLAQAAMGGPLTLRVENVYLLFGIQDNCDAGYAHLLKKLLLEMQPKLISDAVVRSLIHRLYGMTARHDVTDAQQRKRVVFASMKYIMRNLQVVIKNIHIRLETEGSLTSGASPDLSGSSPAPAMRRVPSTDAGLDSTSGSKSIGRNTAAGGGNACFAIGITLPTLQFGPRDHVKERAPPAAAANKSTASASSGNVLQTPGGRGPSANRGTGTTANVPQTPADGKRRQGAGGGDGNVPATPMQTPASKGPGTSNTSTTTGGGGTSNAAPAAAASEGPNPTFHLKLLMKSLQLYADYNCDSYVQRGYGSEDLHHLFAAKWKSEVHTGVLMPFDVDLSLALQLDDATSVFTPTVTVRIPQFHVACDPKQLEVIAVALDRMTKMTVRTKCLYQLTRSGVLTKGYPLPLHLQRTTASSGRHLLPQIHVCTGDGTVMLFPTDHSLQKLSSRFKGGNGTVAYLKDLAGSGWAKIMWRYVIQVVVHDVKAVMPLSRWDRLIELLWARKEYAFMYSKLLKPSRTQNEFAAISDPKTVDSLELVKIHMYEMVLPISTIQCFRVAAVALASASQVHTRLNAIYAKCEEEIASQRRAEQLARARANQAAANASASAASNSSGNTSGSSGANQQQQARPSQTPSRPGTGTGTSNTSNATGRGGSTSNMPPPPSTPGTSTSSNSSNQFATPAKGGGNRQAPQGKPNNSASSSSSASTIASGQTDNASITTSTSSNTASVTYDAALQQRVDEIRRLLKRVSWRDVVCLLTQLELLSEGDDDALAFMSSANSNVNGFAVGLSAAKTIICRSILNIRGSFANRLSGRLCVPSAIAPSAEVREAVRSRYLGEEAEARWGNAKCLDIGYYNSTSSSSNTTSTSKHDRDDHHDNDDDVMSLSANISYMLRGEVPQPAMWLDFDAWQRHVMKSSSSTSTSTSSSNSSTSSSNTYRSRNSSNTYDNDEEDSRYTLLAGMNYSITGYIDTESAKFAAYLPTMNHESMHTSAPLLPAMPQLRQSTLATHNDNIAASSSASSTSGSNAMKGGNNDKFRTPMKPSSSSNTSTSGLAQISFLGDKGFGSPDSTTSNTTTRTSTSMASLTADKFGFGQFKAGMEKASKLSSGLFNLGGGGNKPDMSQHGGSDTSYHAAPSSSSSLFSSFGGGGGSTSTSNTNPTTSASTTSASTTSTGASTGNVTSFSCPYDLDETDDLMDYIPLDVPQQEIAAVLNLPSVSEADRRQLRVLLHLSVSAVTSSDIDAVLYSVHAPKNKSSTSSSTSGGAAATSGAGGGWGGGMDDNSSRGHRSGTVESTMTMDESTSNAMLYGNSTSNKYTTSSTAINTSTSTKPIVLPNPFVRWILDKTTTRMYLTQPTIEIHIASIQLSMREPILPPASGAPRSRIEKRRTYLTIQLDNTELVVNASPSVPPVASNTSTSNTTSNKSKGTTTTSTTTTGANKPPLPPKARKPGTSTSNTSTTTSTPPPISRTSTISNTNATSNANTSTNATAALEETYDEVERLLMTSPQPQTTTTATTNTYDTSTSNNMPSDYPTTANTTKNAASTSTASSLLASSRAASMGGSAKLLDLSGLLVIIRVSIGGIRVCANIQPNEYQDIGTMGVTEQSVSASALAALNQQQQQRRGSSISQFHTPLGGPVVPVDPIAARASATSTSLDAAFDPHRRAREFQDRQRAQWGDMDNSTSTITTTATGGGGNGTTTSAYNNTGTGYTGTKPEKRSSWTTDELLQATKTTNASTTSTNAMGASSNLNATTTNRGKSDSVATQSTYAPPVAGPYSNINATSATSTSAAAVIDDIPMCILSSNSYSKDTGAYSTHIGERFLNACVIMDIPERARSGGNMEAMDVQMGLGPLNITAGRNELAVLASVENITLCYRVLRAVQRMLSLQSVVYDTSYLLRDASTEHSHPMVLTSHIHLANRMSDSDAASARQELDDARTNSGTSTSTSGASPTTRARNMMRLYRNRYHRFGKEELIRRNADVLQYLNYSHWSNILAFSIPKTITFSLRTSEISAKLVSATIMNAITTHWVNVLSEKAMNAIYNAGLHTAQNCGQFVVAQGIISTMKAAVELSATSMSQKRSDWNISGALGAIDADLDSVGGGGGGSITNTNANNAGTGTSNATNKMLHKMGSSQTSIGRDDRTVSSVQQSAAQHQVTINIPALSFELGKCPITTSSSASTTDPTSTSADGAAANATLTAKIFGISISIPVNDLSLYQSLALFLSARAPFYTADTIGLEPVINSNSTSTSDMSNTSTTSATVLSAATTSSLAHAIARTVYESAPLESNTPMPPALVAEGSVAFPVAIAAPPQAINITALASSGSSSSSSSSSSASSSSGSANKASSVSASTSATSTGSGSGRHQYSPMVIEAAAADDDNANSSSTSTSNTNTIGANSNSTSATAAQVQIQVPQHPQPPTTTTASTSTKPTTTSTTTTNTSTSTTSNLLAGTASPWGSDVTYRAPFKATTSTNSTSNNLSNSSTTSNKAVNSSISSTSGFDNFAPTTGTSTNNPTSTGKDDGFWSLPPTSATSTGSNVFDAFAATSTTNNIATATTTATNAATSAEEAASFDWASSEYGAALSAGAAAISRDKREKKSTGSSSNSSSSGISTSINGNNRNGTSSAVEDKFPALTTISDFDNSSMFGGATVTSNNTNTNTNSHTSTSDGDSDSGTDVDVDVEATMLGSIDDELSDAEAIVATAKKYHHHYTEEHTSSSSTSSRNNRQQQDVLGISNSSSTSTLATVSTINTSNMAASKDGTSTSNKTSSNTSTTEQQKASKEATAPTTATATKAAPKSSATTTSTTSTATTPPPLPIAIPSTTTPPPPPPTTTAAAAASTSSTSTSSTSTSVGFGSTMSRLAASAPAAAVANHQHKWRAMDATGFQVRSGPNYKKNKAKTSSNRALYETIAVDVFRINGATPNIGSRLDIAELLRRCDAVTYPSNFTSSSSDGTSAIATATATSPTARPALPIPPLVIIQCMVPCETNGDSSTSSASSASGMFGSLASKVTSSSTGGSPGWSIVIALAMTESTRLQLQDLSSASSAVRLFTKFVRRAADNDELRGQLKVICRSTNIDDLGLPSMVTSYNGTPVLLRKTTSLFRTAQYFEIDINAFQFSAVARHSIRSIVNRANQMVMQIGFVIEGNTDDELPECVFGCVEMHRPLDRLAVNLADIAK